MHALSTKGRQNHHTGSSISRMHEPLSWDNLVKKEVSAEGHTPVAHAEVHDCLLLYRHSRQLAVCSGLSVGALFAPLCLCLRTCISASCCAACRHQQAAISPNLAPTPRSTQHNYQA
jgi:hypothetical protein